MSVEDWLKRLESTLAEPAPPWVSDLVRIVMTVFVTYLVYIIERRMVGQPWAYIGLWAWGLSCAIAMYTEPVQATKRMSQARQ